MRVEAFSYFFFNVRQLQPCLNAHFLPIFLFEIITKLNGWNEKKEYQYKQILLQNFYTKEKDEKQKHTR